MDLPMNFHVQQICCSSGSYIGFDAKQLGTQLSFMFNHSGLKSTHDCTRSENRRGLHDLHVTANCSFGRYIVFEYVWVRWNPKVSLGCPRGSLCEASSASFEYQPWIHSHWMDKEQPWLTKTTCFYKIQIPKSHGIFFAIFWVYFWMVFKCIFKVESKRLGPRQVSTPWHLRSGPLHGWSSPGAGSPASFRGDVRLQIGPDFQWKRLRFSFVFISFQFIS